MDLNQSKDQAAMVRRVKTYKAGFVPSDSNLSISEYNFSRCY